MGYSGSVSSIPTVGEVCFYAPLISTITLTTTAADQTFSSNTITVPSGIPGDAKKVTLGMNIGAIQNTSGATNYTNLAQVLQVSNGGLYTDAIDLPHDSLETNASSYRPGPLIWGLDDLKTLFSTFPKTITVKWVSADAFGNNLLLRDVQFIIKVAFGKS